MRMRLLKRPQLVSEVVREQGTGCRQWEVGFATRARPEHIAKKQLYEPKWDPQSASEGSIKARQLLRALLRECTYLPDAFSRQWMTQHILSRFRIYGFKAWQERQKQPVWATIEWERRVQSKEKEARSGVAFLRRANEGERDCLLRVLLMAYGRVGKRRHDLMRPLLPSKAKEEMGDGQIVKKSETRHDLQEAESGLALTPQLRALLASQIQTAPATLTRPNPRRIDPRIPELNAWLRPMPVKRVRNLKKKHYALLLDRVHPPLPTAEWNHLRDLAMGMTEPATPLPRRTTAVCSTAGHDDAGQTNKSARTALEIVVQYGKAPKKVFENRDAHAMTPRFMRRLYAQVFRQCPLMQWDGENEKWTVVWGEAALYHASSHPEPDAASKQRTEDSEEVEAAPA